MSEWALGGLPLVARLAHAESVTPEGVNSLLNSADP